MILKKNPGFFSEDAGFCTDDIDQERKRQIFLPWKLHSQEQNDYLENANLNTCSKTMKMKTFPPAIVFVCTDV